MIRCAERVTAAVSSKMSYGASFHLGRALYQYNKGGVDNFNWDENEQKQSSGAADEKPEENEPPSAGQSRFFAVREKAPVSAVENGHSWKLGYGPRASRTIRPRFSGIPRQSHTLSPFDGETSRAFATRRPLTTDERKLKRDILRTAQEAVLRFVLGIKCRKDGHLSIRRAWVQLIRCWYERGVRARQDRQKALAVRRVSNMYEQTLKKSRRRSGISVIVVASQNWRRQRLRVAWLLLEYATGTGSGRAATEHQALRWTSSVGIVRRFFLSKRARRAQDAWFHWKQFVADDMAREDATARAAAESSIVSRQVEEHRLLSAKAEEWERIAREHSDVITTEVGAREKHEEEIARLRAKLAREKLSAAERLTLAQQSDAERHRREVAQLVGELGGVRSDIEMQVHERMGEAHRSHAEEKAILRAELEADYRRRELSLEKRHAEEVELLGRELQASRDLANCLPPMSDHQNLRSENNRLKAELQKSEAGAASHLSESQKHAEALAELESIHASDLEAHQVQVLNMETKTRATAATSSAALRRASGLFVWSVIRRLQRGRLWGAWRQWHAFDGTFREDELSEKKQAAVVQLLRSVRTVVRRRLTGVWNTWKVKSSIEDHPLSPPERNAPSPPRTLAAVVQHAASDGVGADDDLFFSPRGDADLEPLQQAVRVTGAVEAAKSPPSFDGLECPACGTLHAWTASVCDNCRSPLRLDNDIIPPPEVRCEIPFLNWLKPKNRQQIDEQARRGNNSPPPYRRTPSMESLSVHSLSRSSHKRFEDQSNVRKRPQKRPPRRSLSAKATSLPPRLGASKQQFKSQPNESARPAAGDLSESSSTDSLALQNNHVKFDGGGAFPQLHSPVEGQSMNNGKVASAPSISEVNKQDASFPQNFPRAIMPMEATAFSTLRDQPLHLPWPEEGAPLGASEYSSLEEVAYFGDDPSTFGAKGPLGFGLSGDANESRPEDDNSSGSNDSL